MTCDEESWSYEDVADFAYVAQNLTPRTKQTVMKLTSKFLLQVSFNDQPSNKKIKPAADIKYRRKLKKNISIIKELDGEAFDV